MRENRKSQVYINVFVHIFVRMRKRAKKKMIENRKLAFVEKKNCDTLCQVSIKVP